MKKLLLILLFGPMVIRLWAQSIIPEVVKVPITGFSHLRATYPYVLTQSADQNNPGNWLNNSLNTFIPAAKPGYKTKVVLSGWETNKWTDYSTVKDSFTYDNQDRFDVVIEDNIYNYPGFSNRYKYRYKFGYDAGGKISQIGVRTANPPSSELYDSMYTYKFVYDANAKRLRDTMYYFQSPTPYVVQYVYNPSGNVKALYWIDLDPNAPKDTANKMFYGWSGNNLLTSASWYFDSDAGEYLQQGGDTFTYDNQNRVASYISYVLSSVNGGAFEMMPYLNETYSYSSTGKLIEIIASSWNDTAWGLSEKTQILYDGNDMPTIGFVYPYNNNTWSQTASERHLFSPLSGLTSMDIKESKGEIWPNPADEQIHLKTEQNLSEISVTDMTGKVCLFLKVKGTENQMPVNISSLKPGMYFMNWQDQEHALGSAGFFKN